MSRVFRKATTNDVPAIWSILQGAIARRKADGSQQWQNGYPNPETIAQDIARGAGFVLTEDEAIVVYSAVIINDEPAYATIQGKWLTEGDFVVVHRVAVAEAYLGLGYVQMMFEYIEQFADQQGIHSVKVDTNFDNPAMLRVLEKQGYAYCGEVLMQGSPRMAFEKKLA